MEELPVKEALLYTFVSRRWAAKMLTILLLLFVPILGWFVVYGYFAKILKSWSEKKHELPPFSGFFGMFTLGFYLFVIAAIIGVIGFILKSIPSLGYILAFAWGILSFFFTPYMVSCIATTGTLSKETFNTRKIINFVGDNILKLLFLLVLMIVCLVILALIVAPFFIGFGLWHANDSFVAGKYVILVLGILIALLGAIYIAFVKFALIGNIYSQWKEKQ
ncbi:hypothetical protein DRQ27_06230 [bacterium]|nr:MAG: hypothetical protein DRQ27_06230 [bacterium]